MPVDDDRTVPDWTDGIERLVLEACPTCAHRWYFRRECCPRCGARDVDRRVSTGRGRLVAVSTIHRGPGEPTTVCLVDLDDGVRVMGRCDPGLSPGVAVEVDFRASVPHFAAP